MSQPKFISYQTKHLDTFDQIALTMYHSEYLAYHIWEANPDYTGVLFFEEGVMLKIPILNDVKAPETLAPWRRKA